MDTKSELSLPVWLQERSLPDSISLQIITMNQDVIFSSKGKWLHPLLDAKTYIDEHALDASKLVLHDRIAGRAAAALAVYIGFGMVKVDMMSRLAETVYIRYHIPYVAHTLVDRILCRTEDEIDDSMDLTTIYNRIVERAQRAKS